MVLPLVDEDKPKCYGCHKSYENLDEVRECLKTKCKTLSDLHERHIPREPAPGDVTVF